MQKKTVEETSTEVEYIGRIREQYDSFSKSQKKVAKYILNHQNEVINYSITMLARRTGTAPSTITRFCQRLSYSGFSELKVYIAKGLLTPDVSAAPIRADDSLQIIVQKLMASTQEAIMDTIRTLNIHTVKRVADVLLEAENIFLLGQSSGYISALRGQQMLLRAGIHCRVMNDPLDTEIAVSTLGPRDVIVGIGSSGEERFVVKAITSARQRGVKVVAITAAAHSTMDHRAHYTLFYSHNIPDDVKYMHIAGMCETAIFGILQVEIMQRPQQQKSSEVSKNILAQRLR